MIYEHHRIAAAFVASRSDALEVMWKVAPESRCGKFLRDGCAMPFRENFSAIAWMEIQK
jgi:hypothetical protein